MEWVESTGSTIAEAKEHALDRLGVHEDDAEFEVVTDVKTGLFGRVKEAARVRARVRPTTPRAKEDRGRSRNRGGRSRGKGGQGRDRQKQAKKPDTRQEAGGKGAAAGRAERESTTARKGTGEKRADRGGNGNNRTRDGRKDRAEKREETVNDDEPMMPLPEQADLAEEFVRGLAERFGADVGFERENVEDDEIRITVTGDDLGRMIGRRGTTAGAIDELVRTVLQRQAGSARNGRIRVDVGGVRARRAEALAAFSRTQAATVRELGVSRALEPMNAADRKIVHDALTDEAGVETISEGEDPHRHVVIVPAGADD